jgi:hypothetical protein
MISHTIEAEMEQRAEDAQTPIVDYVIASGVSSAAIAGLAMFGAVLF